MNRYTIACQIEPARKCKHNGMMLALLLCYCNYWDCWLTNGLNLILASQNTNQ